MPSSARETKKRKGKNRRIHRKNEWSFHALQKKHGKDRNKTPEKENSPMSRIQVFQIRTEGFDDNFSYLLAAENGDAAMVDPCGDLTLVRERLRALGESVRPRYLLLTHGHHDHVEGLSEALSFFPGVPVSFGGGYGGASSSADSRKTDLASRRRASAASDAVCGDDGGIRVKDGERLPFGEDSWIEVLHTPGHSWDSVCYRLGDDSAIFTGDTLFIGCCGYCRAEIMFRTLREKIFPLPDSLIVYSGHDYGDKPFDTLGNQKKINPCLAAEDFRSFRKAVEQL